MNKDTKESMFGNASKFIFENAKELRLNMTETEIMLWEKLKNNQFHGFKFRRQHPFDSFVLDFYCHEARIAIEIDGSVHDTNEQKEYDIQRSNALELAGIHVIRFKNNLVKENLDEVLNQVYSALISRDPPPPSEGGGARHFGILCISMDNYTN